MPEDVSAEILALQASVDAILAAVQFKRAELNVLVDAAQNAANQAALLLGQPSPFDSRMRFTDGNALAPSMTFASDLSTGLFRTNEGRIGFSVGGVLRGSWGDDGLAIDGATTGTALINSETPAEARSALAAAPLASPNFTGSGSIGKFGVTDTGDFSLTTALPSFLVGSYSDYNLSLASGRIQARRTQATLREAAPLAINTLGGNVSIGNATSVINLNGSVVVIRATDDTPAAPSYTWQSSPALGMYRIGSQSIGWAIDGLNAMTLDSADLRVYGVRVSRVSTSTTSGTTDFPIGTTILVSTANAYNRNALIVPYTSSGSSQTYDDVGGTALAGQWRSRGRFAGQNVFLAQRVS